MITRDNSIVQKVWTEIRELEKIGVRVNKFSYVVAADEATGLHENGASIRDIADLCVSLGG